MGRREGGRERRRREEEKEEGEEKEEQEEERNEEGKKRGRDKAVQSNFGFGQMNSPFPFILWPNGRAEMARKMANGQWNRK